MFIRISKIRLFISVPMSLIIHRSELESHLTTMHPKSGVIASTYVEIKGYLKKPLNWLLPATGAWQRFAGGAWVVSATWVLTISDLERFSKHTNKTGDLRLLLDENENLHLLTNRRLLPTEGTPASPKQWTLETAPAEHPCPACSSAFQPLAPLVQSLSSPDLAGYLTDSGNFLEADFSNLCVGFILGPGRIPKLTETRALRHFFEIYFNQPDINMTLK